MERTKHSKTQNVVILPRNRLCLNDRHASKERETFGIDSAPVQQLDVNRITGMNRLACQVFQHGFNNLALTKTDHSGVRRGIGVLPDPNFMKHDLGRYPSDERPQKLRQSEAQANRMKTVRNKLQAHQVRPIFGHKSLRELQAVRPRQLGSKTYLAQLDQRRVDPRIVQA